LRFSVAVAFDFRSGGECGIIIPSGIYTDLGAKQLREMLFTRTRITGLFCFENRKEIFEGVHRSYKFIVLTFERDGVTKSFPAAFMRLDVEELQQFPQEGAIELSVPMIRRLSPSSLSVMEFKTPLDVVIAEKMLQFPLLEEEIPGKWRVRFTQELNMTSDSHLFKTKPAKGRLPLYEGKMMHQFTHEFLGPRYWVVEREARSVTLGRSSDNGQMLDYQVCRLGFRDIARNTDERTMISTIIPATFHGNKLPTVRIFDDAGTRLITDAEQCFLSGIWNSFTLDFFLRMKVSATLNFFYINQLPVPRLTAADAAFAPIVKRAAQLICTTPEFDALAKEVSTALAKSEIGNRK
jgi:hypothetical protein